MKLHETLKALSEGKRVRLKNAPKNQHYFYDNINKVLRNQDGKEATFSDNDSINKLLLKYMENDDWEEIKMVPFRNIVVNGKFDWNGCIFTKVAFHTDKHGVVYGRISNSTTSFFEMNDDTLVTPLY